MGESVSARARSNPYVEVKVLRDCDDGFLLSYCFMAIRERKPESFSSFLKVAVMVFFVIQFFSILRVK